MTTAYEFMKNPIRNDITYDNPINGKRLSYKKIVKFLKELNVVYDDKDIYFMDENGTYSVVDDSTFFTLISKYLDLFVGEDDDFELTTYVFSNIMLNIRTLSVAALQNEYEDFVENGGGIEYKIHDTEDFKLIHVRNGVVNPETGYLTSYPYMKDGDMNGAEMPDTLPKSPLLFLKNPFNVDYKQMSLGEVLTSPYAEPYNIMFPNKDTRDVFFMCLGMIIFSPYTWKMLPVLYGPPHTGKTVITLALNELLGDEYQSSTPLNALTSRFGLANADKYILNVVPEGGSNTDATMTSTQCGIIKSLLGGDKVSIERKGRDSYVKKPTMKLMISTNYLPQFPPDEEGMLARMFLFPLLTPMPFTEQMKKNPNYVPDMTRTPEAINWLFNRALYGYYQLCEHGRNNLEELRTPEMLELFEEYKKGDEFTAWVDERFEDKSLTEIQNELRGAVNREVWNSFEEYIDVEWGVAPKLTRMGFSKKLCKTFDLGTWVTRDDFSGTVVRKYYPNNEIKERKKALEGKDRVSWN